MSAADQCTEQADGSQSAARSDSCAPRAPTLAQSQTIDTKRQAKHSLHRFMPWYDVRAVPHR